MGKTRLMYSQRSYSLFGDYPSRSADQSQGYGSMNSDSRANQTKDQSGPIESPNMYSRYLERARTVRDKKDKESEDEIFKQFTALNERIDKNAQEVNKGITEVMENSKSSLDNLQSSINEKISNISAQYSKLEEMMNTFLESQKKLKVETESQSVQTETVIHVKGNYQANRNSSEEDHQRRKRTPLRRKRTPLQDLDRNVRQTKCSSSTGSRSELSRTIHEEPRRKEPVKIRTRTCSDSRSINSKNELRVRLQKRRLAQIEEEPNPFKNREPLPKRKPNLNASINISMNNKSVIYSSDDAENGLNDSANTTVSLLKRSFRLSPDRHSTPLKTQSSEEFISTGMHKGSDNRMVQSDWKQSPSIKSKTKRWIDFTSESE